MPVSLPISYATVRLRWATMAHEGDQNLTPPNMSLRHKNYFELIIFKKQQSNSENPNSENRVEVTLFVRDIYTSKGNLHL